MSSSARKPPLGAETGTKAFWRRVGLSLLASTALLAFLASQVDAAGMASLWTRISPDYAVLAIAFFLGNLGVRGLRLRSLAQPVEEPASHLSWIRLCSLHQLFFSLLPSGAADIGFPLLASRTLGCRPSVATRVVLVYRLQDLWALLILFAAALVLLEIDTMLSLPALLVGILVAAACLYWANDLTRALGIFALRLLEPRENRWRSVVALLHQVAAELDRPATRGLRFHGTVMTLASWVLATLSLWSLFAMVDVVLGPAETFLVIAGMNLIGAISVFTVAGLGVGESGLAAILLALGFGSASAIAIALIVRPAALASVVVSTGLIEGAYHLVRRFRLWTRRTGETTVRREQS